MRSKLGATDRSGLLGSAPGNPVVFVPSRTDVALGYVDGPAVAFERRFAAGRSDLLDEFAADRPAERMT